MAKRAPAVISTDKTKLEVIADGDTIENKYIQVSTNAKNLITNGTSGLSAELTTKNDKAIKFLGNGTKSDPLSAYIKLEDGFGNILSNTANGLLAVMKNPSYENEYSVNTDGEILTPAFPEYRTKEYMDINFNSDVSCVVDLSAAPDWVYDTYSYELIIVSTNNNGVGIDGAKKIKFKLPAGVPLYSHDGLWLNDTEISEYEVPLVASNNNAQSKSVIKVSIEYSKYYGRYCQWRVDYVNTPPDNVLTYTAEGTIPATVGPHPLMLSIKNLPTRYQYFYWNFTAELILTSETTSNNDVEVRYSLASGAWHTYKSKFDNTPGGGGRVISPPVVVSSSRTSVVDGTVAFPAAGGIITNNTGDVINVKIKFTATKMPLAQQPITKNLDMTKYQEPAQP